MRVYTLTRVLYITCLIYFEDICPQRFLDLLFYMSSKIPVTGTPLVWIYMENNTPVNKFAQNLPNYDFNVFEVEYRSRSNGTTVFSSSNTKFGPQSLYFEILNTWARSYSTTLQCKDDNPVILDKEFTISLWVYLNSADTGDSYLAQLYFVGLSNKGRNDSRRDINNFGIHDYYWRENQPIIQGITATTPSVTCPKQQWVHVACTYDTEKYRLFLNGQLISEGYTKNPNPLTLNQIVWLDSYRTSAYAEDMVLIKDQCLWTENFTPPTGPLFESYLVIPNFPKITGEVPIDIRGIDNKIINLGSVIPTRIAKNTNISSNTKFSDKIAATNASTTYDNSSIYLNTFTLSWWANILSNDTGDGWDGICFTNETISFYFLLRQANRGQFNCVFYNNSGQALKNIKINSSTTNGVWYHYAIIYDGSNFKVYKNGSLIADFQYSNIGTLKNFSFYSLINPIGHCIFDDVVLIKDQILWTENFDPPNCLLTGIKKLPKKIYSRQLHYPSRVGDYFDQAYLY